MGNQLLTTLWLDYGWILIKLWLEFDRIYDHQWARDWRPQWDQKISAEIRADRDRQCRIRRNTMLAQVGYYAYLSKHSEIPAHRWHSQWGLIPAVIELEFDRGLARPEVQSDRGQISIRLWSSSLEPSARTSASEVLGQRNIVHFTSIGWLIVFNRDAL